MDTGFSQFNPTVQLLFFASVLTVTMMIMNPVLLIISSVSALLYLAYYGGADKIVRYLKTAFFSSAMIIVINPLISHKGITILAYLPDGNPLTLESVIFGAAAAAMLSCVIFWFFTVNYIFTSDKVICLFGNFMPRIALLISMTLNFTEKLKVQFMSVKAVQAEMGCDTKNGSVFTRIKNTVKVFSALIQWLMESSVDTADSMNSRGYGLKKRTSYTVYRFFPRDIAAVVIIVIFDIAIIASFCSGRFKYSYYPSFSVGKQGALTFAAYVVFAALCIMPLTINFREDRKWKSLRSDI